MKTLYSGSLLIELLIYLSLFAILGAMSFAWFTRSQRQLLATAQFTNGLMSLYSATDLLVRDLRSSPQDPNAWFVQGAEQIIWHGSGLDIGWYKEKNALYRVEGIYNARQGKWSKKKRSLAIQNLKSAHFEIKKEVGRVARIEITLLLETGGAKHMVRETIYPRESLS